MTVNHSSVLSVEYFESYFHLVISSRNYEIDKAKEFIIQNFFKGNVKQYGEDTCLSFCLAYSRLTDRI
ncbi:hypothetical protein [Robertmurraya sp. P23]|uniref:hypothetical protein n=1 Tax=Robertmurraya sp. P23 TaxID=3436931 RepID=UPI003D958544